jgi:transcriptional regulator with XRE-family HTH domain
MQTKAPPLRTIRKAQGLSLRQVSQRAKVDLGHLSRIERGQAGVTINTLARLAAVLGLRQLAEMLEPYTTPQTRSPAVAGNKASARNQHAQGSNRT